MGLKTFLHIHLGIRKEEQKQASTERDQVAKQINKFFENSSLTVSQFLSIGRENFYLNVCLPGFLQIDVSPL